MAGGEGATFTVETILRIHHVLLVDDPYENEWAGRLRTMQNWIGDCPEAHAAMKQRLVTRNVPTTD